MPKLKDLFSLNIEQDINLVIKADEQNSALAEKEIDEYIVTEEIEDLLEKFLQSYVIDSTEKTNVWISGFFGSGKSYFAKILGYLIENPILPTGLTVHDKFKERLNASNKKEFIEGRLSHIEKIKAKVVIFEIIKDSSYSENEKIQKIMLKKLFEKFGYARDLNVSSIEYDLEKQGYYNDFKDYLRQKNVDPEIVRENQGVFRRYLMDYLTNKQNFSSEDAINFSKSAIHNYLDDLTPASFTKICLEISEKMKERIVFIIDEMGSFVTSQKDNDGYLAQLQGIAESFAKDGRGKLWLIVTSQEKLDQVTHLIEKKNNLSKIIDRFPIRLDITSKNVDEIVRKRMLQKKTEKIPDIEKIFNAKKGNIQAITDIGTYPKTENLDSFKNYYPFFEYHIQRLIPDLIQSPTGSVYAQANERKLISIVETILKSLKDEEYTRCVSFVDIFDSLGVFFGSGRIEHIFNLDRKFECSNSTIKPSEVMKALEIMRNVKMNSNEDVITKVLISDLNQDIYKLKEYVHNCVELLEQDQQVTVYDGKIEIVSDIEKEFISYKEQQSITLPDKKKKIEEILRESLNLSFTYKEEGPSIPIEWSYDENKRGRSGGILIKIESLLKDAGEQNIEDVEFESANHKETIYVIPKQMDEIEEKVDEIEKINKAINTFQNQNIEHFNDIRTKYETILKEKSNELKKEIRSTLDNGIIIYYYNKKYVNGKLEDSIKEIINSHVISTYYPNITSYKAKIEDVKKILTEPKNKLYLIRTDSDHAVFNKDGELLEGHKLINNISQFIKKNTRGSDIIENFSKSPYGWTQETIMYAVAAMVRSGKIRVNESDDYTNDQTISILTTPKNFKDANFSLNYSIPVEEKETILKFFNEIAKEDKLEIGDPNSKFLKVGEKVFRKLVEDSKYVNETIQVLNVDENLPTESLDVNDLNIFLPKIENGDLQVLRDIYSNIKRFRELSIKISEDKEFIKNNSDSLKQKKDFVNQVFDEIRKVSSINKDEIEKNIQQFKNMILYPLTNKEKINELFEKIRNEYKIIFKPFHDEKEKILKEFSELLENSSQKKNELGEIVREQKWFSDYQREIKDHECTELKITFSFKCDNCRLGLYETQLLSTKMESDLKEFQEELDKFMKKSYEIAKNVPVEKTTIIKLKKKIKYGDLKKKISNISTDDGTVIEIELEDQ